MLRQAQPRLMAVTTNLTGPTRPVLAGRTAEPGAQWRNSGSDGERASAGRSSGWKTAIWAGCLLVTLARPAARPKSNPLWSVRRSRCAPASGRRRAWSGESSPGRGSPSSPWRVDVAVRRPVRYAAAADLRPPLTDEIRPVTVARNSSVMPCPISACLSVGNNGPRHDCSVSPS